MDIATPIPGFITRKQASERCRRSERTLQRYWSSAIERRETTILERLKLRTEDGEVVEGGDVTKELIDRLKKERRNPTWYVHATWVAKTYGMRLDDEKGEQDKNSTVITPEPVASSPLPAGTHVTLLEQRIRDLERDKEQLHNELKIKNDQIGQANERSKETHVLMRDLHGLLGDLQRRLPPPATTQSPLADATPETSASASIAVPHAVTIEVPDEHSAEKGSRRSAKQRTHPSAQTPRRPKTPNAKSPKQKADAIDLPPSVFAKHTPTFQRAWSRLFRRV